MRSLSSSWLRAVVASWVVIGAAMTSNAQNQTPPRTIDKGAHSNIDERQTASARTAVEWTALWKKHNFDKPAPAVDFSKELVVAVFMGSRPTAGYAVEIVSAAERGGKLVITYKETLPSPGAISAQVLTAPYHIAAAPKSSLPVEFEKLP